VNNGAALHYSRCRTVEARRNEEEEEEEGKEDEGSGAADQAEALVAALVAVALGQTMLFLSVFSLSSVSALPPVLSPFSVLLLFLFSLSTMFSPLSNHFVAVLLFLVVHSGGFVVADDNSRWLFPYSLLLFPWFSFSSFFYFCSLWFQRQFPPKSFPI